VVGHTDVSTANFRVPVNHSVSGRHWPMAGHPPRTPSRFKIARYESASFPIQCTVTVLRVPDRRYYAAVPERRKT
jgi:hypothetical protein